MDFAILMLSSVHRQRRLEQDYRRIHRMDPCVVHNLENFLRLSCVQHGSWRHLLQVAWNYSQPNSSRRNRSHFAAALFAQEFEVLGPVFFVGRDGHVSRVAFSFS
jgi:hypothetical protein